MEAAGHSETSVPLSLPTSYPRRHPSESYFSGDRPYRELTEHLTDVHSLERSINSTQLSDMVSLYNRLMILVSDGDVTV